MIVHSCKMPKFAYRIINLNNKIMKKFGKLLAIAALAMVSLNASAELQPQWEKGTMIGNANIGFGGCDFGTTVSLDYVLVDEWWMGHFTVGGIIGLSTQKIASNDKYRYIAASPRCTYGLNITDQFEVHATVSLGLGFVSEKWDDIDGVHHKDSKIREFYEDMIGCRYFFADGLAAMAEMGYSDHMPELRVGISYKF